MIIKLNITLDHQEDVYRELIINAHLSLEDLHKAILEIFQLNKEEMAAFYLTNEEWEQGQEIPLIAMDEKAKEMKNLCIKDIFQNQNTLLYVNDFLILWRFMIEAEEIDETKNLEAFQLMLSFGNMPQEAPNVQFVSDQDDYLDEDQDIFGDAMDEFNDYEEYDEY